MPALWRDHQEDQGGGAGYLLLPAVPARAASASTSSSDVTSNVVATYSERNFATPATPPKRGVLPRLVPNPLGDVLQPLQRMEKAIGELSGELEDIKRLPKIHAELTEVNKSLVAVQGLLGEILEELRVPSPSSNGKAAR